MRVILAATGGAVLVGWWAAAVGCGCVDLPCPARLTVQVRHEAWPAGTWALRVAGEGLALDCVWLIPLDGAGPFPADITCDDRADRTVYLADTGLPVDPAALDLRTTVQAEGGARPESVQVSLAWTGVAQGEGPPPTWSLTESRALSWAPVDAPSGTCWVDCAAAHLALVVEGT